MRQFNEKKLGYYGSTYELKVIKQLIGTKEPRGDKWRRDDSFGRKMLKKLSIEHFDNHSAKIILENLKGYYTKYNKIPWFDTLESIIKNNTIGNELQGELLLEYVEKIKKIDDEDYESVQENSVGFINTKNMFLTWEKILREYVNQGRYGEYKAAAQLMQDTLVEIADEDELEAMTAGDNRDLEEGERHTITSGLPILDKIMNGGLAIGELALGIAGLKVGKEQPNSCKIYTPTGYKLMGDIEVGDIILGSNGKSQEVLGVYPKGVKDVYKVEFSDNTHTFCGKEHLWSVQGRQEVRKNLRYITLSLEEIMNNLKRSSGQANYRIPVIKPVDFKSNPLLINPYIMGIMIGDGSLSGNFGFSTKDESIVKKIQNILGSDYLVKYKGKYDYNITYTLTSNINPLKEYFEQVGLLNKKSNSKFIPKEYLFASLEDRKELLRGLIDSDGCISPKGLISYTSVSKQLIEDFRFLILSLGGFCGKITSRHPSYTYNGEKKIGQLAYRVNVTLTEEIKVVSHINRKQSKYKPRTKKAKSKVIKEITLVGQEECTCIKVSNEDCLYVTDDFILTHNTTLASILANNAAMAGYNVLQIYFEDTTEQVKLKHRSKFSKLPLGSITKQNNRKTVIKRSDEKLNKMKSLGGCFVPHKMSSRNSTTADIRNVIKKARDRGVWFADEQEYRKITFDLVIIDYVDCIQSVSRHDKKWGGDEEIMRDLEDMCSLKHGLGFACWAFTQGGRGSLNTTLVNVEDMGGSITKAQIGHFIFSIAKTLEQRSAGHGTFAVLGSRIGADGIVFKDCIFDNGNMEIELMDEGKISDITTNDAYAK